MRRYILSCLLVVLLLSACRIFAEPVGKKLIDATAAPTPQRLIRDLAVMDNGFLDGVVMAIPGSGIDDSINRCPLTWAFSNRKWKREWFTKAIADLQMIHPKKLVNNFVDLNANPGDVDWFDDAGWKEIVDHWRMAAWIAKQGNLKGILFDPEPYTPPYRTFNYSMQPNRTKHTFTEYYDKARQRGREVMKAVSEEYPDATLMTYFLLSYPVISDSWLGVSPVGMQDRMKGLSLNSYGLLVGFIDGWLDVIPPTMKVVDGCERGYDYDTESEFLRAAVKMRVDAQELISPENRYKYRAQFQAGFGIYMDAHAFQDKQYILDAKGLSRTELLRNDVRHALFASDEYVWLWNERGTLWPNPTGTDGEKRRSRKQWSELMPGCEDALRAAVDPTNYEIARAKKMIADGSALDIAQNGSFDPLASHVKPGFFLSDWEIEHTPAYWSQYPAGRPQSELGIDKSMGFSSPGSARIVGRQEGIFIQAYDVSPGQCYLLSVESRHVGVMIPQVEVRWLDSSGAWLNDTKTRYVGVDAIPEGKEGAWIEVNRVFTVPARAGKMLVMLNGSNGREQTDACWWDDLHVYHLPQRSCVK